MKKTILTILLCGIMVLEITGCGNNSEQSNDQNREQLSDNEYQNISDISSELGVNTDYLFKFNSIVYSKSYSIIDYVGCEKFIGTIDNLIDSKYIPKNNGETNNSEMLNANICSADNNAAVILFNNEYVLFESIK